ncbi:MAG TPA: hypothetical protein VLU73_05835 [Methylococcaceae bacterium]|jgi:hypothetical protein|nr:hypothetical protein [Methylococcaceae bacterium]
MAVSDGAALPTMTQLASVSVRKPCTWNHRMDFTYFQSTAKVCSFSSNSMIVVGMTFSYCVSLCHSTGIVWIRHIHGAIDNLGRRGESVSVWMLKMSAGLRYLAFVDALPMPLARDSSKSLLCLNVAPNCMD